jgi:hypothetical protein
MPESRANCNAQRQKDEDKHGRVVGEGVCGPEMHFMAGGKGPAWNSVEKSSLM